MMAMKKAAASIVQVIADAVEPLRADAVAAAEQRARNIAKALEEDLLAHAGDRHACAPCPQFRDGNVVAKRARYNLLHRLTVSTSSGYRGECDQDPGCIDVDRVEKFVQDTKDEASRQYSIFIEKLSLKIGPCDGAKLEGNHVWGHSILTVTKDNGLTAQSWKTHEIVNTSVHGKLFCQWPTRLILRRDP